MFATAAFFVSYLKKTLLVSNKNAFSYWLPSSSLVKVFDGASSVINKIRSINFSTHALVSEDLNIHKKRIGLADRPGELCYNFPNPNNVTLMVNSPI